jgi:hypothetical protein
MNALDWGLVPVRLHQVSQSAHQLPDRIAGYTLFLLKILSLKYFAEPHLRAIFISKCPALPEVTA